MLSIAPCCVRPASGCRSIRGTLQIATARGSTSIRGRSRFPNGVTRLSTEADAESLASFDAFDQHTGRSSMTLGAIMRLDEVKRPLLWIETAASVLGRLPDARVIIVGDGPFRSKVKARGGPRHASRCLSSDGRAMSATGCQDGRPDAAFRKGAQRLMRRSLPGVRDRPRRAGRRAPVPVRLALSPASILAKRGGRLIAGVVVNRPPEAMGIGRAFCENAFPVAPCCRDAGIPYRPAGASLATLQPCRRSRAKVQLIRDERPRSAGFLPSGTAIMHPCDRRGAGKHRE